MNVPAQDDERAARGFMLMNAVRIASLGAVILGIAGANAALPLPYAVSVVLAIGGLIAFFFAPRLIARRFKSQPQGEEE